MCFFFQAEDGIRDYKVTGVQTCALPIYRRAELPDVKTPAHGARALVAECQLIDLRLPLAIERSPQHDGARTQIEPLCETHRAEEIQPRGRFARDLGPRVAVGGGDHVEREARRLCRRHERPRGRGGEDQVDYADRARCGAHWNTTGSCGSLAPTRRGSAAIKASTDAPSKSVPMHFRSSEIASTGMRPERYARALVIASNASATWTMRAASGISSPRKPYG